VYVRGKYYSQTKPVLKVTELLKMKMSCAYGKVCRLRCECDVKLTCSAVCGKEREKLFLRFVNATGCAAVDVA
jgi:hypothetical protein